MGNAPKNILVIQTAFTGDAILGTAMLETLHFAYQDAKISYLVRKGNESLFSEHPYLHELLVWDKKNNKNKNLFLMVKEIRKRRYDLVITLQRFASSGILAAFSGSDDIRGFQKNPISFLFHKRIPHSLSDGRHETERNFDLVRDLCPINRKPRLYPSQQHFKTVERKRPYVCLAPASVWPTKQWPAVHFAELIKHLSDEIDIVLTGGKSDFGLCEEIIRLSGKPATNLAGKYNMLESSALIAGATVTVSNDSAPVHMASAMNAPVIEIYCSTVPQFGFSPLSDQMRTIETTENLSCRPCGIHGKKSCPQKHFKCGNDITPDIVARSIRVFFPLS